MRYAIPLVSLLAISSTIYAFSIETDPQKIIEQENREAVLECLENVQSWTWTAYIMQRQIERCSRIQLKSITWTASGAIVPPPQWYTSKHSLNLEWKHDYRIYSDRNWAIWKNNNPSGLTWGVSNTLKWLWKDRWIEFEKWTLRPKNEWGNYILFPTIEHGLRAKVIAIRERWGKATVSQFLAWWGTDDVKLSFDKSKIISNLSEEEFAELFIQQMKKESPWLVTQLVIDNILIIWQ